MTRNTCRGLVILLPSIVTTDLFQRLYTDTSSLTPYLYFPSFWVTVDPTQVLFPLTVRWSSILLPFTTWVVIPSYFDLRLMSIPCARVMTYKTLLSKQLCSSSVPLSFSVRLLVKNTISVVDSTWTLTLTGEHGRSGFVSVDLFSCLEKPHYVQI